MSDDDDSTEEIVTEEMLWERIPETQGLDRANTYYELSARIYARGQYDEALALAETARDIYAELGSVVPPDGLAQAYSAIGYNLNQLKRMSEAATAMSKAVAILRESKSPLAIDLACTLGEWWFSSKEYEKTIECMKQCVQEHLVDSNDSGAANDLHLIGCAQRELKNYGDALESFQEARVLFKKIKEVINVARCDQKIAHCLVEIGDGEGALIAAQRSLDVFVTAHDHYRETYSLLELGKAQIIAGQGEEGLNTLDRVLEIATDNESKDFEFILEIEGRMADVLQTLGRVDEADEIRRRIKAVEEVVKEE
ncbi:MAG: tetratricopeptide repeat protein [Actinobacteria bacterium]|nr:tetratricopeptide repeat protein [Actinomycetota bacterium]MSW22397.1 tetratricopeptide repeat protein [Actinomycetota bacterium]MSX03803.1 tetratricopeptide repeat protein [Actinomycetota bacterium]MSX60865.1 tetratricopeptide repeat protein [Actinomycetota bacterium]MSX83801.1 tetratricopeptide repeat protein [Actinomycetota bacterium]